MSGRRGGNRIRGPQSALTDFLAANNISAAQIRDDYERRRRQAEQDSNAGEGASAGTPDANDDEAIAAAVAAEAEEEAEKAAKSKKRKRDAEEAKAKVKKAKASASKKIKKKSKKDGSDDDESDGDYADEDFAKDMYKKSRPAPGQLEHCDVCNKRFTVTPYSKEGPDGGLLCTPCGKELAKDTKVEKKAAAKPAGRKRRKLESERLDGVAAGGAKSLQELCISKLAQHHDDIEELGDMPQPVLERLSEIFSKKRVLKPKTLPLFLRPDLDAVVVHDAAYLETEDYDRIFATVPKMEKLVIGNACQMKDNTIDYMLDKCHSLRHLQLYAANLVSDDMWHRLFREAGAKLEVVQLKWLDAAFEDLAVRDMVKYAPNLKRLKLKLCRRIGEDAVNYIADIPELEHLSLLMNKEVSTTSLVELVTKRGARLRTLSLEKFIDADDTLLQTVHDTCRQLAKLRISENDTATDAGYKALFTNWTNPPLSFVDFNSTRDIDNNNPEGPEEAVGLASGGFRAMMAHSGVALKHVDVSSCRHIELSAFMDVFNGAMNYPALEKINLSFCNRVDNSVVAGIFKSCPNLKKLVAFGCFNVQDVVVPRSIALIGIPKAQDAIEQFGIGISIEEALGRMVEVGA
ncbi:glycosyltransferase family 34 [Lecanosticta acicola]|uniref:Glycosyltransferase family 34 n=1 Tax=Lecanosticta acicola TaxID=111012 RepID=A0AAI8Z047_9PEZI|nr:glycosyltransferase family 34 [Lecanosticta acicola]